MTSVLFDFYGYTITVTSSDAQVTDGVRRDFAWFYVASAPQPTDLRIDLEMEAPDYAGLPHAPASVITPRNVCFQHQNLTYLDYFGRALAIFNRQDNTLTAHGTDTDLMREIAYLFILSKVGQHLDSLKLHRLHALGACYAGRSILLLLPSGGGKSTMALRLIREPGFSLLSEDTPLIDRRGRAHAFPLCAGVRLGKDPGIPQQFLRTVRRMEFDPKTLVDIAYFSDRIASVAEPGVVLVGQRNLGNASDIVPLPFHSAAMALVKNMVVGLGVYQGLEFLLERGIGELLGQSGVARSRFIASMKLLSRAPAYRFVLGRDIDRNYQTLLKFIHSRWPQPATMPQTPDPMAPPVAA